MRLLAKQLLDDASTSRGFARRGIFESEKSFATAKGQLQTDKGIGEKLISRILRDMPGMTERSIRDSLERLKASGDYARTLAVITQQIEAEAEAARRALGDESDSAR